MIAPTLTFPGPALELFAIANEAIGQLPPAFPLAATVAVNPFLGQTTEPRDVAAARLARVAGIRIARPRAELLAMYEDGRLTGADLRAAAVSGGFSFEALEAALRAPEPVLQPLPTVADLATGATGIDLSEMVEDRIGCWAAAHFDGGQAFWPALGGGHYESWRNFASRDLSPGIAGLDRFAEEVAALPTDPRSAFAVACETLQLTSESAPLYLHRLLMTLGGWAQYARHFGWLAERDGGQDDTAFELLTIRMVWDALLLTRQGPEVQKTWTDQLATFAEPVVPTEADRLAMALQDAADRANERALAVTFDGAAPMAGTRPAIQAAFCIDVRSEILRRGLEASDSGLATLGFAGFFGLSTTHRAMGSDTAEARAPVLLQPALQTVTEASTEEDFALRIRRRAERAWGRFKMAAVSAFAFVEAAGPLYIAKLLRDARPRARAHVTEPAPRADLPLADRIDAAKAVLRAMSLTSGFARLILIAGHGSRVTNAPHASALQCGACGGHAGDVNARLLAGLLNDPAVRAGLAKAGIEVPGDTLFVAGLHDTVSDEVTLFDDHPAPDHGPDLARLRKALTAGAALARAERALVLPRGGDGTDLARRGGDWSDLRPEWGLAGCSAFIAAPRSRSVGFDLGGRAFLHDYDWQVDDGFGTLELILTAPVVVASWISLQYNGSALAPSVFGGGNKLIHNVVGGIGVVEGTGGLLRPGLPWQSVHDGDALRHEPTRLTVVVEAPTEAIDSILDRHPEVRALFDNGWLALMVMDEAGRITTRYDGGSWTVTAPPPAQGLAAA